MRTLLQACVSHTFFFQTWSFLLLLEQSMTELKRKAPLLAAYILTSTSSTGPIAASMGAVTAVMAAAQLLLISLDQYIYLNAKEIRP